MRAFIQMKSQQSFYDLCENFRYSPVEVFFLFFFCCWWCELHKRNFLLVVVAVQLKKLLYVLWLPSTTNCAAVCQFFATVKITFLLPWYVSRPSQSAQKAPHNFKLNFQQCARLHKFKYTNFPPSHSPLTLTICFSPCYAANFAPHELWIHKIENSCEFHFIGLRALYTQQLFSGWALNLNKTSVFPLLRRWRVHSTH